MTPAARKPAASRKSKPEAPKEKPKDVPVDALMDEKDPVMEIDLLEPERGELEIAGERYELLLMTELGIAEQHKLKREIEEYDRLWNQARLSPKDRKRLKQLLDQLFEQVLFAPDELKRKMNDSARNQVVLGFAVAPVAKALAQQAKMEEKEKEEQEARAASTTET